MIKNFQKTRVKLMKKAISVIVLSLFIISISNVNLFSVEVNANLAIGSVLKMPIILDPGEGRVIDTFKGEARKLVIYIQDAHCHGEAQENISRILGSLREVYGKDMNKIFLEGAWARLDTRFLKSLPDTYGLKENLLQKLLKRGILTGPEKYDITNHEYKTKLIGIEDKSLYKKNCSILLDSFTLRRESMLFIRLLNDKLNEKKKNLYNKELLGFESMLRDYDNNKLGLAAYLKNLKEYSEGFGISFNREYPTLSKVLYLHNINLSMNRLSLIRSQAEAFEEELEYVLDEKEKSMLNGLKSEGGSRYYLYLSHIIDTKNMYVSKRYKVLKKYLVDLKYSENIDTNKSVEEDSSLRLRIKRNMANRGGEQRVLEAAEILAKFKGFMNNELTYKESRLLLSNWEREYNKLRKFIEENKDDIIWYERINRLTAKMNKQIKIMKEFYRITNRRNKVLVKNILKHKDKVLVSVVGGYHTEGMTELFKNKGISYTVISPNLTQCNDTKIYESLLKCQDNRKGSISGKLGNRSLGIMHLCDPNLKLDQIKGFLEVMKEDITDIVEENRNEGLIKLIKNSLQEAEINKVELIEGMFIKLKKLLKEKFKDKDFEIKIDKTEHKLEIIVKEEKVLELNLEDYVKEKKEEEPILYEEEEESSDSDVEIDSDEESDYDEKPKKRKPFFPSIFKSKQEGYISETKTATCGLSNGIWSPTTDYLEGNNCFFNAGIQAICTNPNILDNIMAAITKETAQGKDRAKIVRLKNLYNLILAMRLKDKENIKKYRRALRELIAYDFHGKFYFDRHHGSVEFINYMLDDIGIENIEIQSITTPTEGNDRVVRREDRKDNILKLNPTAGTVQGCVDKYLEEETLTGNNKYLIKEDTEDPSNNEYVSANRRFKLLGVGPEYLNIQLSRGMGLINTEIEHSKVLEIRFGEQRERYELEGLIYYQGNARYGHYMYHRKEGTEWIKYNDHRVSGVSHELIPNDGGVFYIYRKTGAATEAKDIKEYVYDKNIPKVEKKKKKKADEIINNLAQALFRGQEEAVDSNTFMQGLNYLKLEGDASRLGTIKYEELTGFEMADWEKEYLIMLKELILLRLKERKDYKYFNGSEFIGIKIESEKELNAGDREDVYWLTLNKYRIKLTSPKKGAVFAARTFSEKRVEFDKYLKFLEGVATKYDSNKYLEIEVKGQKQYILPRQLKADYSLYKEFEKSEAKETKYVKSEVKGDGYCLLRALGKGIINLMQAGQINTEVFGKLEIAAEEKEYLKNNIKEANLEAEDDEYQDRLRKALNEHLKNTDGEYIKEGEEAKGLWVTELLSFRDIFGVELKFISRYTTNNSLANLSGVEGYKNVIIIGEQSTGGHFWWVRDTQEDFGSLQGVRAVRRFSKLTGIGEESRPYILRKELESMSKPNLANRFKEEGTVLPLLEEAFNTKKIKIIDTKSVSEEAYILKIGDTLFLTKLMKESLELVFDGILDQFVEERSKEEDFYKDLVLRLEEFKEYIKIHEKEERELLKGKEVKNIKEAIASLKSRHRGAGGEKGLAQDLDVVLDIAKQCVLIRNLLAGVDIESQKLILEDNIKKHIPIVTDTSLGTIEHILELSNIKRGDNISRLYDALLISVIKSRGIGKFQNGLNTVLGQTMEYILSLSNQKLDKDPNWLQYNKEQIHFMLTSV